MAAWAASGVGGDLGGLELPCQRAWTLGPGICRCGRQRQAFYWLFQHQPDRILPLLPDLPADARGYSFSAPALKEREYRLDGLFLPPPERPPLPALILAAQMAADGSLLQAKGPGRQGGLCNASRTLWRSCVRGRKNAADARRLRYYLTVNCCLLSDL